MLLEDKNIFWAEEDSEGRLTGELVTLSKQTKYINFMPPRLRKRARYRYVGDYTLEDFNKEVKKERLNKD